MNAHTPQQLQSNARAARASLAEAERLTRQLGLKHVLKLILLAEDELERARFTESQASRPHSSDESPPLPSWLSMLSRREVEVLRLVAQGKSNRQIAQELVISERTVAGHIASIFTKTGVENRAGATAFAMRNRLAW